MGQASIPTLNRVGYSMFWASVWDDIHMYNRFFREDIYIKKYILQVFLEKNSTRPSFLENKFIYKIKHDYSLCDKYNLNVLNNLSIYSFSEYLFWINKIPNYFSKIYIMRFQHWLIIFMYVYSPKSHKNVKKINYHYNYFYFHKKYYLYNLIKKYNLRLDLNSSRFTF